MENPQNGWFMRENPNLKWMIWGYPYFRKPPYMIIYEDIHIIVGSGMWFLGK